MIKTKLTKENWKKRKREILIFTSKYFAYSKKKICIFSFCVSLKFHGFVADRIQIITKKMVNLNDSCIFAS